MVQQSKPWRANSFMTEYSPWPGTWRSNTLDVTDEPWTKNSTGREGSPGFGTPSRLRYIYKGISPFFAQYSLLQISPVSEVAATAPCADAPASVPATRPSPAPLMTVRRASNRSRCVMTSSDWTFYLDVEHESSRRRMRPEVHRSARTGLLPAKTGLVFPPFKQG